MEDDRSNRMITITRCVPQVCGTKRALGSEDELAPLEHQPLRYFDSLHEVAKLSTKNGQIARGVDEGS
jgi:ethanolamine utilization cobalamin adenosyltransferase